MYKLLLVVDDPFVREGLADLVDWEKIGFYVCDLCGIGDEVLEQITKEQPHLVVIDIEMGNHKGLILIREIKKIQKDCQFIVLSDCPEGRLAKEMVELEVRGYVQKPVDEKELLRFARRIGKRLTQREKMNHLQETFDLRNILDGNLCELPSHYAESWYQLALFTRSRHDKEVMKLAKDMGKVLTMENYLVLICEDSDEEVVKEKLCQWSRRYQIKIALGTKQQIGQVKWCFEDLRKRLERSFCFEENLLLSSQEFKNLPRAERPKLEDIYKAIEFGDEGSKQHILARLKAYYQTTEFSSQRIKGELSLLQIRLIENFKKQYTGVFLPNSEMIFEKVFEKSSLSAILDDMEKVWAEMYEELVSNYSSEDFLIQRIESYIAKYYNQPLNLQVIGKIFNYSPTYLGKKFKNDVGTSLPKYVDSVRIENAKRLLREESHKVFEVSEQVGFSNYAYFTQKFKQHVGLSPKEYQKKSRI